jgi:uncharacterized membrane protein YeaQ/YmgE (transglycosylase-associated protein family)
MAAIASWIALGGLVGYVATMLSRAEFPGGRAGASVAGAAGAFVGGGVVTLLASGDVGSIDVLSLAAAAAGAAVVLAAVHKAQWAAPRPR